MRLTPPLIALAACLAAASAAIEEAAAHLRRLMLGDGGSPMRRWAEEAARPREGTAAPELVAAVWELLDERGVSPGDLLILQPVALDSVKLTDPRTLLAESVHSLADTGNQGLLLLGSKRARRRPDEPGLLPCRIHSFFRGLPGLWACTDPDCTGVDAPGPIGKLYDQPRDCCDHCGARVFEFFVIDHDFF